MTDRTGRIALAAHASVRGTWHMSLLAPSARMAPFVRQLNAYSERDTLFARRRELPTGAAVLVFNLGAELRVEHPLDTQTRFVGGTAFYCGPSANYAVTETDGAQTGAQAMLTLPGARRLLGRPLGEVGDRLTDPVDLLGAAPAREIIGRLMEAPTQGERLAILEQMLACRLADGSAAPRALEWAWERLQASAGRVRIGALAAELGCSRKHLTVRFHHEFGMPPKLFARILRFDRAMRLLRREPSPSWAELAVACGYADQAHLAREVRAFTGSAPAAFLRRRLPDNGGFTDDPR
ncbi:MAG TPA: helix-turn-helix domain-containing protein [Acetobacteraceae bacterium]|jgi:AraC-like DNA-binding protein|nr:helix-turn-helix domain-containing protein [Acetobacteraceae bacterium]